MKYAASVTVLDDEGNIAFERELTQDEIIDELLAALPDADAPVADGEPELEAAPPPVARSARPALSGEGKSCCGSKGHRHMKGCADAGTKPAKEPKPRKVRVESPDEDEQSDEPEEQKAAELLTEDQFDEVKELRSFHDWSSIKIASETGFDLQQVNYAMLSATFGGYIAHASR